MKHQKVFDRVLWLDHNEIISLPDDIFYECEKIEQINLAANQLEYVQHFLFADLESLEQVFLQDNKLNFMYGIFDLLAGMHFDTFFLYFSFLRADILALVNSRGLKLALFKSEGSPTLHP